MESTAGQLEVELKKMYKNGTYDVYKTVGLEVAYRERWSYNNPKASLTNSVISY